MIGKGDIFIVFSNGCGQSFSNLKAFNFVPSLSSFRELFISSHSGLTGVISGAPNPGAPGRGYVSDDIDEYGWIWLVYYDEWNVYCTTTRMEFMGFWDSDWTYFCAFWMWFW